jgi:hypothetical protein
MFAFPGAWFSSIMRFVFSQFKDDLRLLKTSFFVEVIPGGNLTFKIFFFPVGAYFMQSVINAFLVPGANPHGIKCFFAFGFPARIVHSFIGVVKSTRLLLSIFHPVDCLQFL